MNTTEQLRAEHAALGNKREPHWPDGVVTVSLDALNNLGVDRAGNLYWDGSLIKTTKKVSLDTKEFVLACLVGAATFIGAGATAVQAWYAAFPVKP